MQSSPRSRLSGKTLETAPTDTQDSDNEGFNDTIQDTFSIGTTVAQLREDDKFHTMSRYVCYIDLSSLLFQRTRFDANETSDALIMSQMKREFWMKSRAYVIIERTFKLQHDDVIFVENIGKIAQDAFDSLICSPVYFFAFLLREELNEQLELKRKEKKKMRKILKKFEDDFFEETGRYVAYDLAQYSCDIQLCYRQKQCSAFQAVTGKTCRL